MHALIVQATPTNSFLAVDIEADVFTVSFHMVFVFFVETRYSHEPFYGRGTLHASRGLEHFPDLPCQQRFF